MKMPVYERWHYLNNLRSELEKKEEMMEEARTNSKSGGKNTKRVSGDTLKQKMKSGEIQ